MPRGCLEVRRETLFGEGIRGGRKGFRAGNRREGVRLEPVPTLGAPQEAPLSRRELLGAPRGLTEPRPSTRLGLRSLLGRFARSDREGPGQELGQSVLARKPVLVAVVSRKGGVGKTASAAAIAAVLGEALDPFGHTAERMAERALTREYRACIEEILRTVSPRTLATAVDIAKLPEGIRGYGHVKARHLASVRRGKPRTRGGARGRQG